MDIKEIFDHVSKSQLLSHIIKLGLNIDPVV